MSTPKVQVTYVENKITGEIEIETQVIDTNLVEIPISNYERLHDYAYYEALGELDSE